MKYLKLFESFWYSEQNNEGELINDKWIVGKKIGSGTTAFAYNIKGNPDKIIKIFIFRTKAYHKMVNEFNIKMIKIMQDNPDICSKIYDYGFYDKTNTIYVVSEKLNTSKVKSEFKYIQHKFGDILIGKEPKNFVSIIKNLINNDDKNTANIAKRWYNLFEKSKKIRVPMKNYTIYDYLLFIFSKKEIIDFHNGNFGYDSNNNLKMFDI